MGHQRYGEVDARAGIPTSDGTGAISLIAISAQPVCAAPLRGAAPKMAGVDLFTVQYRGTGEALPDFINGDCTWSSIPLRVHHLHPAGKLQPLGVTTATRMNVLPDVLPIGDVVPGYAARGAPLEREAPAFDRRTADAGGGLACGSSLIGLPPVPGLRGLKMAPKHRQSS